MEYEFGDIIALTDNHEYSILCSYLDQEMEYYLLLDNEDASKQILIKKEKNNEEIIVVKDRNEIDEVLKKMGNS